MPQRTVRVLVVPTLFALLLASSPSQAAVAGSPRSARSVASTSLAASVGSTGLLSRLWETFYGSMTLWLPLGSNEGGSIDPNGGNKEGGMIDPDGAPHATSTPTGPVGEEGGMIDPDGRK